jgi:3alpha(or 20beta)-hydroxysteroid dehydrogenase
MGRLTGKTAIITGAARGMGAATARAFVAEGANVVVTDVLISEGEETAAALGDKAIFLNHDVSDEQAWQDCVKKARDHFGSIDVLLNNAGIIHYATIVDMQLADFERVLKINLTGTFLGMKAVAPVMFEQGRGSIINVSSTTGLLPNNGMGAYGTSKWGVRGITKVAALEMGPKGVRVNSIHPGGTNTQMANPDNSEPEALKALFRLQPIQRIAAPEEIANLSVFLASDESSYICGAEIAVDGGMTTGAYMAHVPGFPE